jgi:ribosomal protein L29
MEKFAKLLESKAKSQKPMSGPEKDAKLRAVHEMRKMASDEMATPLKHLKKVTVASNDPEGLKSGLDKAKQMLEGSPEEEASESPKDEMIEDQHGDSDAEMQDEGEVPDHQEAEQMSPEELQAKIMELQKLLAAKKMP